MEIFLGGWALEKEIEKDGHLPFSGVDIYRRPGGSLGRKIYRKPSHTDLDLHPASHHPSNKQAVLATLVHRARAICDKDSLTEELGFLAAIFKENGYSSQQIKRAINPSPLRECVCPASSEHMVDSPECWLNTSVAFPYLHVSWNTERRPTTDDARSVLCFLLVRPGLCRSVHSIQPDQT